MGHTKPCNSPLFIANGRFFFIASAPLWPLQCPIMNSMTGHSSSLLITWDVWIAQWCSISFVPPEPWFNSQSRSPDKWKLMLLELDHILGGGEIGNSCNSCNWEHNLLVKGGKDCSTWICPVITLRAMSTFGARSREYPRDQYNSLLIIGISSITLLVLTCMIITLHKCITLLYMI